MTQYFVRYSDCQEWLEGDAERGYSFHSYIFAASPEALLEEAGYDLEEYDAEDLAEQQNVMQHSNGQYGFALAGLCGYGPFETIEEAEAETVNGSYATFEIRGIYEGRSVGIDPDGNELFRPTKLVKVLA